MRGSTSPWLGSPKKIFKLTDFTPFTTLAVIHGVVEQPRQCLAGLIPVRQIQKLVIGDVEDKTLNHEAGRAFCRRDPLRRHLVAQRLDDSNHPLVPLGGKRVFRNTV